MIKRFFKWLSEWLQVIGVVAAVIGFIVAVVALLYVIFIVKWNVYHQRFPNASFWTFFFD